MRTQLFQGCCRSEISVTPKNWKTQKAKIKGPWKIHYRFYDPVFRKNPKMWGKQVLIRGMNEYNDLGRRQKITASLIEQEKELLDVQGYNPITGLFMRPPAAEESKIVDISPTNNFITALEAARLRLSVIHAVRIDIKSVIGGVEKVCRQLFDSELNKYYLDLQISQISRKHIKNILDLCGKTRKRWSAKRHNLYKCYLSMLFTELLELEAVQLNPTRDISSKVQPQKVRQVLTADEIAIIDAHLKEINYNFWRYMKIFFYSGSRTTELLQLRKNQQVNLKEQTFIVRVIKGGQDIEDIRGISNEVLDLWKELWHEAKAGQVLFSKHLQPGDRVIRKDQIGRRWRIYIKERLGIKKDFNTLKHFHTDAVAAKLSLKAAQIADGHTTDRTTKKHYALGEKKRELEKVKSAGIIFGQPVGLN
jgi:integrase